MLRQAYEEAIHTNTFIYCCDTLGLEPDLINTIKAEFPDFWTNEFQKNLIDLIKKSVELEKIYARDACHEGIVEINSEQFIDYVDILLIED